MALQVSVKLSPKFHTTVVRPTREGTFQLFSPLLFPLLFHRVISQIYYLPASPCLCHCILKGKPGSDKLISRIPINQQEKDTRAQQKDEI